MATLSIYVVLLVGLISISLGSSITRRQAPGGICGGGSCPSYSVIKKLETDIEERNYEPVDLPSYKSTQCMDFNTAVSQAYFQLTMYSRAGQNSNKKPLSMGAPVLTKVEHANDVEPKCAQIYTTSFYVSDKPLPAPTNADIKITPLAATHFYVQTIGGYISDPEASLVDFRVRLNAHKLCYDKTTYYIANYQSPGKATDRKNEIWIAAKSCAVPT